MLHLKKKSRNTWEWAAYACSVTATVLVAKSLNLEQKWDDAVVYTVLVFVAVAVSVRDIQNISFFWLKLLALFALHVSVIAFATGNLSEASNGIRGIPMILSGSVEGIAIIAILFKGSQRRTRIPRYKDDGESN